MFKLIDTWSKKPMFIAHNVITFTYALFMCPAMLNSLCDKNTFF